MLTTKGISCTYFSDRDEADGVLAHTGCDEALSQTALLVSVPFHVSGNTEGERKKEHVYYFETRLFGWGASAVGKMQFVNGQPIR